MSAPETFTATLQFGDVIQIGHPDNTTNDIHWREPRVVMGAHISHLELSQIVEDDGEVLLTTIGTEWGIVRKIEGQERWTPTKAAIAMIESLWGDTEEERCANDYEVLRIIAKSIDILRTSLIAEAEKGPVAYSYIPKTN